MRWICRIGSIAAGGVTALALVALADGQTLKPIELVTTDRVPFQPGGVIRIERSRGSVSVAGWDQPQIEIKLTRTMPLERNPKHPDVERQRLEAIHATAERRSEKDVAISISGDPGGVLLDFEIHVPRESSAVIHHDTGFVLVSDIAGDVEASCRRGDIVVMLADLASYAIDARSKFGAVTPDLEGAGKAAWYRLGQSFVAAGQAAPHKLHLRAGFGGVTIEALPRAALARKSL